MLTGYTESEIIIIVSTAVFLSIVFVLFLAVIWRNYLLSAAKQRLEKEVCHRKQIEEELRRNKERFDLAVDGTKDGLWDWDLETNEAYYSDRFARMLGYEPEELPYTSAAWSDQLHPDDRKKAFAQLQAYLDGKTEVYESTFRMRTKSGEYRWITGRGRCVRENGKPIRMVGFNTDITKRKKAEIELQKSEEKWKNILINTPQVGITLNPKAEIIFANAQFLKLTGWKEAEVIGQNWFDMFIPDNIREEVRNVFLTTMKQKNTSGLSTYENKILDRFGSVFDVAWSNVLTKNDQGNIVDITCLGIDLTERKKGEKELQASEDKFSKAFYRSPLLMTISKIDNGRYLEVNEEFCRKTGYDKNDVIGKTSVEIGFISPKDRLRIIQELDNSGRVSELELKLTKKDGSSIVCLYSGERIEIGGQNRLLSIAVDLTEWKKMEKRIQDSQKMDSMGNLAGGIAHDFNNILFPIIGMSEMLLEDLPSGSGEKDNAKEILKAGKRGRDLVKQILTFSRQSEHKMMPTRIQNVLKEVMKLSRSTIPTYIEIKQDIHQNCGMVLADPSQIHQIGMNIMTNAYHAIEDTGGTISVSLKQKVIGQQESVDINISPGVYVVLSISDTGQGMSKELIGKIFDPYFTTKKQGKGTGLGLAVVYGIVKDHGGHIEIYSEIDEGSKFDIYFPLMEKLKDTASLPMADVFQGGHERILVVDDEESIAKLEKQMLERMGYTVTSRLHSVEALEAFKANPSSFDLVVTDMNMPNIPGDVLARKIKSIRSDVPIVICTGFSERIHEHNFEHTGIDGLLMKPIITSELAKVVRKVLDAAKSKNHE